jgi:hypothetical protein
MLYRNLSFIAAFCALILINSGCKKYEPQYEGAWTDAQANNALSIPREIVYLDGSSIYMTDRYHFKPKLVSSNAANANITHLVFSPKHDKIAYTSSTSSYLYVIDTLGKVLTSNIYAPSLDYFEWHSDNNLLYGLQYNVIKAFYGGTLPTGLPTIPLSRSAEFAYITPENDVLYFAIGNFFYVKNGQTSAQAQQIPIGTTWTPNYFRKANESNIGVTQYNNFHITINNRSIGSVVRPDYADTPLSDGNKMRIESGYMKYFVTAKNGFFHENDYDNRFSIPPYVYDIK